MTQLTRLIPSDRIIRLQGAIIIAVALLFAGLLGSRFFSLGNFQSIASQLPILGLLALGMGITMLTGGINLSIIAGANACSLVMAAIIVSHPDQPLFLVLALLAACWWRWRSARSTAHWWPGSAYRRSSPRSAP